MFEIRHYITANERDVYFDWFLRVRDMKARIAIERRVSRVELCGGDKRTQDADINRACDYWQDWQRRNNDER